MKRILPKKNQQSFDLIVVGGGIYGAAVAYYATLNNVSVALFEKDDFCAHTSANSQKVIHGGLRYLQSFDFKRVIESIRERQRFYGLFPHLVQPLPCVLPVSGYGTKSREAMAAAFFLYRWLQKLASRKGFSAHSERSPHLISSAETLRMFPHLQQKNIRGGALWYDGLCLEPERVVINLLKSAASRKAVIANYAKALRISRLDNSLFSVLIQDRLQNTEYKITGKKIALCTGPWLKQDLGPEKIPTEIKKTTLISGINIITDQITDSGTSIALKPCDPEKSGLFFVLPWKKHSIAGTVWADGNSFPKESQASSHSNAASLNQAVHDCYPAGKMTQTVKKAHLGYVPGIADVAKDPADRILSHYRLIDLEADGRGDVLQVVGVKFTTAFDVALKVLGKLYPKQKFNDSLTAESLPVGSMIEEPDIHFQSLIKEYGDRVDEKDLKMIFQLLGTESEKVLRSFILSKSPEKDEIVSKGDVLKGLTGFFIEEEMVFSLPDLLFRRLFPGMPGIPAITELDIVGKEMASRLNWTTEYLAQEKQKILTDY